MCSFRLLSFCQDTPIKVLDPDADVQSKISGKEGGEVPEPVAGTLPLERDFVNC